MTTPAQDLKDFGKDYQYGFHDSTEGYVFQSGKGLNAAIVNSISSMKKEPEWMHAFRMKALDTFLKKPMPGWADTAMLEAIDFDNIHYYMKPSAGEGKKTWDEVPEGIKNTFDRLGIPEAERKFLAGVTAQYESEVVYHSIRKDLEQLGVIFLGMDDGLKQYPDIVKKYFGTVIPPADNKFSALNSAVWSGGSFIYVPKGVKAPIPLQAYFRINSENMGQFERTLIIADEGSFVHYIEGCLPAGEVVSRGDTFCPIEDVGAGEEVLNGAGELARVSATRKRPYQGTLVGITPVSVGNAFEVTPEHPVLAFRREKVSRRRTNRPPSRWDVVKSELMGGEPEWVPAGELKPGDILCFPIARRVMDHPELTDDHLRFLGYYLAEGSAFENGANGAPTVTLSFNLKEREKIKDALRLMTRLSGKTAQEYQVAEKHESRAYVYSRPLMELCWKYCGRHAPTKVLHRDIMELPPGRQKLLLDTYWAGDGSRHPRGNGRFLMRALTVSRTLAFQVQEILARLGVYAGIQVRRAHRETMKSGRAVNHREAYMIHYEAGKTVQQVWRDDRRGCFWVPVRRISSRPYDGWVFNLEMEKAPNSYIARGFVVHNCTAPTYSSDSLHSAVVELIALPGAKIRYTTIQNWSKNVYNLVTKRAMAHKNAVVEWIDGNLGSKLTMKYPAVYLVGEGARGEILSVAFSGEGQHQDAGAKVVHVAPRTTSVVTSKSISKDGGRSSYRGLVKVHQGATGCKSSVRCDALLMDEKSRSDTYPTMEIDEQDASTGHEATVSKIGEEQLFYLQSRGLSEQDATMMIVNGFFEPFTKELPMEYAVELNRLLELEMEGAVG
jgi:Fe-S cluster assembly protein SufB